MRQVIAILGVLSSVGCSAQIRRLDPKWDGATEPQCTTSYLPVAGDAAVAGIAAGIGFGALESADNHPAAMNSTDHTQDIGIGALVVAGVFALASAIGEDAVSDCRTAHIAWQGTGALRAKAAVTQTAAPTPAFFCASSASSPSVGICARQQPVCVQARNAAVGAVPDLAVCAAASSAWCFGAGDAERCAATQQACTEQRAHAGDGADACHEVR